jgi:hypothetical protein
MKKLNKLIVIYILYAVGSNGYAQQIFIERTDSARKYAMPTPYQITAYATHEIDLKTGAKTALYRYKFQNNSKDYVGQIELGEAPNGENNHDDYFLGYQAFDSYGKRAAKPLKIISPNNWGYEIQNVDESNQYVIQWAVSGNNSTSVYGIAPNTINDNFLIRMPKADKKFVSTYMSGWVEYKPALVQSFDKTPPQMSVSLISQIDAQRAGWLKVQIQSTIKDNYDPYPAVRLSAITSTDKTFKATDIDALLDEETKVFWVKCSPNRQYSIKFTGMDASGNKVEQVQTLWAP